MTIIDKYGVLNNLSQFQPLILELGCGNRKRQEHSIGIDILDYEAVDIVGDIFEVFQQIPDQSVDVVASHHFFEHIDDLNRLMAELARISSIGGKLEIVVPHFSNPYFYSDPTHRSFFGLYTFSYYAKSPFFKRLVPTYQRELKFELLQAKLVFKSPPPFYVRYGFKKILEKVFNSSYFFKEFYEENLCYIFPCYEINYQLRRIDPNT